MKRTVLKSLAVLAVSLVLAPAVCRAQETKISVKIPFDFTVGRETLPAGEYQAGPVTDNGVIVLRGVNTKAAVMFLTSPESAKGDVSPKMVFSRYGDKYILSQIWMDEGRTGHVLGKSRLEKELAMSKGSRQEVVLAAQAR